MSKPFVRIGSIEKPKSSFPETVEALKATIGEMEGFTLGGIHRWAPEAFSFEFHNDRLVSLLLEDEWEHVWALPLFKLGVYLQGDAIHLNLRRPAYFLDLLASDMEGEKRWEIDQIFMEFMGRVITFFRSSEAELGDFSLHDVEEGYDVSDTRMAFLARLHRSREIFRTKIDGDAKEKVRVIADRVVQGFDELEGWKIIDRRAYRWGPENENLHFIEFCTPKYAGISMEMNRAYNLLLPCLGAVRSDRGSAIISIYRPTFMFRPLFWSVPAEVRKEYAGFPAVVEKIIRTTCLKNQV